jgi:peptide/nickel transport system permease protein
LLITIGILIVISMLIFLIMEVLPGDIARLRAGQFATPEEVDLARHQLGLDRPVYFRYLHWLGGFISGNWGESWRFQIPIAPLIHRRLVNSAILAGLALVVIVPVSIAGGVLAALHERRPLDHIVTMGGMIGIAVPEFVSSMFLILIFSLWLPLLPSWAFIPEGTSPLASINYLILPVVALTLVLFGYISRMVRVSMVEELRSNYTRTAVLKGLSFPTVVIKHVLRNALLPSITVIANQLSWLIGGLVVVENVFNFPGLGQLLVQAAVGHDVPMLEVTVLIVAGTLMLSNLIADLLYGLANPRVRVQSAKGQA